MIIVVTILSEFLTPNCSLSVKAVLQDVNLLNRLNVFKLYNYKYIPQIDMKTENATVKLLSNKWDTLTPLQSRISKWHESHRGHIRKSFLFAQIPSLRDYYF